MAHQLEINDGQASMMYVETVPWHGLGTQLDHPPTAEGAIRAAKLDWNVAKKPLYAKEGTHWQKVPDAFALVREDEWGTERSTIFATVKDSYRPLQNSEAFSFFDPLIKSRRATYETAGALGEGERVWVLAKLSEDFDVAKDDALQRYLLLFNGHDARTSVRIVFTPIRVVCQNTLSWALREANVEFRASHGRSLHKRLDQAREEVDMLIEQYDALSRSFVSMTQIPMGDVAIDAYLKSVFPEPERRNLTDRTFEAAKAETAKRRKNCAMLAAEGKGNKAPGVQGTLWAAYNGVTEWADHVVDHQSPHQRFRDLFFGEVSRTKSRALDAALKLVKGANR